MTATVAISVVGAFLLAFHALRIVPIVREAWEVTRAAAAAMRDPAGDDATREAAARLAARRLSAATVHILLRGVLALALALVPAVVADRAGLMPLGAAIAYLSRLDVILVTSAAIVAGLLAGPRLWPGS
jgi:hypothetical protein